MKTTALSTRVPPLAGFASFAVAYIFAAIVLFFSLPSFAHAESGCDDAHRPPMRQNGHMPPPPPDGAPTMGMQHMPPPLADLDLSGAQRKQIDELMQAQSTKFQSAESAVRQTMQDLQRLAMTGEFDAAKAKQLADMHGKAVANLSYLHAETQAKIQGLLTDGQRKQLAERMERHEPRPFR